MPEYPEYVEVLRSAFVDLWAQAMLFLPKLAFAVLVFIVGVAAAVVLQKLVVRVVEMIKVDDLMERMEVTHLFKRAGITLSVSGLLGWIVKWFVIIFAFIAFADILGWNQITVFLSDVVAYIPNIVIAIIILLAGLLLGGFVQNLIRGAVSTKIESVNFLAGSAKWSVVVFSFMAALVQLGIAESLIQVLFTGFVAMIAIAGGLAFGLGGREHAAKILNQLEKDFSGKGEGEEKGEKSDAAWRG